MKMTTIKRMLGAAILCGTVGLAPQLALADESSDEAPSAQSDFRPSRVSMTKVPDHNEAQTRGTDERGTYEEMDLRATDHAAVQARGTGHELGAVSASGIPDHAEAQARSTE
jgi:hypothetical protein